MNRHAYEFRRTLSRRLLALVTLALPATSLGQVGCSDTGTTSSSGDCVEPHTETNTGTVERFLAWPPAMNTGGAGGAGGGGGMNASGGAGGGGGMNATGGAGGSGGASATNQCPSDIEATKIFYQQAIDSGAIGELHVSAVGTNPGGVIDANGQCAYMVTTTTVMVFPRLCYGGRAYVVEDETRVAEPAPPTATQHWGDADLLPAVESLDETARTQLARAYGKAGFFEHASVASFGRFALELLAVGAPAELVELAHRAALDEVRHARLCFALASAYAGQTIAPDRFPFDGQVRVSADLADLAARTVREGCVGETIAACIAAEQHGLATDAAVRSALGEIMADEARHAELAFRTVAWALREGGAPVRAAVIEAFAALGNEMPADDDDGVDDSLESTLATHGQLGRRAKQEAIIRAWREVVEPAAKTLLAETAWLAPASSLRPTTCPLDAHA